MSGEKHAERLRARAILSLQVLKGVSMKQVLSFCAVLGAIVLLSPQNGWCEGGYRIIAPKGNSPSVSMELRDVQIQSALKMLAEIENSNIAFQRDVNGKIRSFQVTGVPAEQVLDIVLKMNGLYAEQEGNVVIVYPIEEYIRFAKARRDLWGDQ